MALPAATNHPRMSLKPQQTWCGTPHQWSRMRCRIKRLKVFRITKRRSNGKNKMATITGSKNLRAKDLSYEEENARNEIDMCNLPFLSAQERKGELFLNMNSLCCKYQPKNFADIIGHEITVKAISKAVEKMKIVPLYLFYGPCGTGKTSTARIFAMALNCQSTSCVKPCWSCRGCSRSLYIMELCCGSRMEGFKRIKTLLQSTSFAHAIPGFRVLIIKDCHSFNAKEWDEFLDMLERGYSSRIIFILIIEDENGIPQNISSRCQKFCFHKLRGKEIAVKLARIVVCEGIRIEEEALELIATTAKGSLREAENLLDQLVLLESAITTSMVQQLVGLLPQNKLADLLATAISGDTINTIRYTRELIATGVEPQILISQLASLAADIISRANIADSMTSPGLSKEQLSSRLLPSTNSQSERLCHALKILVETEKQLSSSSDQNSRTLAALLEITLDNVGNRITTNFVLPSNISTTWRLSSISSIELAFKEVEKLPNWENRSDMDEIWQNMLRRIQNIPIKEFLCHQVKLASLTISNVNIIVHLMFKRQADKMAAQISEESISRALESAMGCPVTVNMSVEPVGLGIVEGNAFNRSQSSHGFERQLRIPLIADIFHNTDSEAAANHSIQEEPSRLSETSRPVNLNYCTPSQGKSKYPLEEDEACTAWPQKILPLRDGTKEQSQVDRGQSGTAKRPKQRWLSLSSIPMSDASVERYSQDILYEKAHKERDSNKRKNQKFRKGFSNTAEGHDSKEAQDSAMLQ
ncbi:DNA-directed DNA polymerase [Bertholletia excelsa]